MHLDLSGFDSLGDAILHTCERLPEKIALIEADRDRENGRWTYQEVRSEAERVAARLQELAFEPGDRCAIIMSNQSKWLMSGVGAFWAGAVLIPLDYKLQPREKMVLLAHCRAKVLVTEWSLWKELCHEKQDPIANTVIIVVEAPEGAELGRALRWELPAEGPFRYQARKRDDLATIIYSSGTGGRIKGCMLTHGNYLKQIEQCADRVKLKEEERYFSVLPTNHAIDFVCGFVYPLTLGSTVVHQRTLRGQYLADTIKKYRVHVTAFVPLILKSIQQKISDRLKTLPAWKKTIFKGLVGLNRMVTRQRPRHAISRILLKGVHDQFGGHLRLIIAGGTFIEPQMARFFYDLGLTLGIGYGLTESTNVVASTDLEPFHHDNVGRPVPGNIIEVRKPDESGVGEIWIKGPCVMKGYLDDPELTAETIVDGWLHTGDLGQIDGHGCLRIIGRSKNMIVTEGGKNVYPEDIEMVFEGLPQCEEYCVFAANYIWPTREPKADQLLIVVKPEKGQVDEKMLEELRDRNRDLADYKRVSSYLIWHHDFPRTASLKIKRHLLCKEIQTTLDRQTALQPL